MNKDNKYKEELRKKVSINSKKVLEIINKEKTNKKNKEKEEER